MFIHFFAFNVYSPIDKIGNFSFKTSYHFGQFQKLHQKLYHQIPKNKITNNTRTSFKSNWK